MGDITKKKVERKSLVEREAERATRRQEIKNDNETCDKTTTSVI